MSLPARRLIPAFLLSLAAALCAVLNASCTGSPGATPPVGPAASPPPSKPYKLVIIRLDDPAGVPEPPETDVVDGLKYGGFAGNAYYALSSRSAEGDRAKIANVVEAALKDEPDLILTLHPDTTRIVAEKTSKVPLAFGITSNPYVIGLGKDPVDHKANLTGAFMSLEHSLALRMGLHCMSKSKLFGILFNPDEPESVAHKDALIRAGAEMVPVATAEFHSESEVTSAVQALLDKKVNAIFLTIGIGRGATAAIEQATRAKIPVFGFTRDHVKAGAIMSRLPDVRWSGFEAGRRGARILKGESPSAIPFTEGSGYTTFVNTKAAKALGVTIPGDFMRDAEVYGGE